MHKLREMINVIIDVNNIFIIFQLGKHEIFTNFQLRN